MAGTKETPRQKMIGMMYLVLMALLAMNVSKEVLNSFVVINGAIEKTNKAFTLKNDQTFNEFEKQKSINPAKVGPFYDKAKQVIDDSKELDEYITELKKLLIAETEGFKGENALQMYEQARTEEGVPADSVWDLRHVQAKDNYDVATHMLIGSDPMRPTEGEHTALELRQKIESWKASMISLVPERSRDQYKAEIGFEFSPVQVADDEIQDWEAGNFYHVPLAAVITNLSRYQSDLKNAESDALKLLFSEISAEDFKFDTLAVRVMPNSNYIVLGDSFKADVFVAAYSTTDNPILEVGSDIDTSSASETDWKLIDQQDTSRIKIRDGVASYGFKPSSEGEVNWGGFIKIRKPGSEEYKTYPFKHSFIAAKPSMVVSPTKMNIVYRGLQNPVDVSVSGFSSNQIQVNVSNGSLSGSNGSYEVLPGKGNECRVSVSVKTKDGGTKSMGEQVFRVKNVPKPEPYFAGITGSAKVPSSRLKVADVILAKMENFEFEGVKWDIVSFELLGSNRGKIVPPLKARGNRLTSQMKNLLNVQSRGDRLFIQNIFAVGPGGVRKSLGSISIEVQ